MSALATVLDAGGASTSVLLERVEERMRELIGGHGAVLARYAGQTIAAGGKRLRPLLVGLAAGVPVPDSERLVRAAVAVELVHAASLVHDDVLARAALRRGQPTVVASAGRPLAAATGDLLFSRAFAELARGGSIVPVRILSRASSELAAGELMQRADAFQSDVGVARYLERCRLKTGVLFRAACELGALVGCPAELERLGSFGEQLGVAFQLLDDVLDVVGAQGQTGKPRGTDLLDGTVTLPLILARERDPELARLALRELGSAEQALKVCERIACSGAIDLVRERALGLVGAAKTSLSELPDLQRGVLELVADGVVERYA